MNGRKRKLHHAGVSPARLLEKDPKDMTNEEIEAELEKLYASMEGVNFSIDLNKGVPARFVYTIVREVLNEEFEFIAGAVGTSTVAAAIARVVFSAPGAKLAAIPAGLKMRKRGKWFIPLKCGAILYPARFPWKFCEPGKKKKMNVSASIKRGITIPFNNHTREFLFRQD